MWSEDDAGKHIVCHQKVNLVERVRDTDDWAIPNKARCMGSICSAWRWAHYVNANNEEHFKACAPPGSTLGEPVGYCALLGVPDEEAEARP